MDKSKTTYVSETYVIEKLDAPSFWFPVDTIRYYDIDSVFKAYRVLRDEFPSDHLRIVRNLKEVIHMELPK